MGGGGLAGGGGDGEGGEDGGTEGGDEGGGVDGGGGEGPRTTTETRSNERTRTAVPSCTIKYVSNSVLVTLV